MVNHRNKIIDALRQGRLIVVTGTGVTAALSRQHPQSSWRGLLLHGISQVEALNPDKAALLRLQLEAATVAEEYAEVAGGIRRHLGDDFERWITRTIGEISTVDASLATAIGQLGAPILTTNYDTLLDDHLGLAPVCWTNASAMRSLLSGEPRGVGHLHGHWRNAAKVIFASADYQQIATDKPAMQIQTSAFTVNKFLFIGMGDGLDDPNFRPMVRELEELFPGAPAAHYRLVREGQEDPRSELKSVIDVTYGPDYDQLATFLHDLAKDANTETASIRRKSRTALTDATRENSTLFRESADLAEKTFEELVVKPTFLNEPHSYYATKRVVGPHAEKPEPVNMDDVLQSSRIVVIAGEENSGVSTALAYALVRAMELRHDAYAVLVPTPPAGLEPVVRIARSTVGQWTDSKPAAVDLSHAIIGIDNIRMAGERAFDRVVEDIRNTPCELYILGARQADAVEVASKLSGSTDVTIVYVGRFGELETREIASRIDPQRAEAMAQEALMVVREKHLPRTPLTLTLIILLMESGITLSGETTETVVLSQYLDLLLDEDVRTLQSVPQLTVRQKRRILETLARNLVNRREDTAQYEDSVRWIREMFGEFGWDHFPPEECLDELVRRRILKKSADSRIGFQQSSYLDLMAGTAAQGDEDFRQVIFGAPLQLAPIIASYAALSRGDARLLELIRGELARIKPTELTGTTFGRIKQVAPVDALFEDRTEPEGEGSSNESGSHPDSVSRQGITGSYYDDSSDEDAPTFLNSHIDEMSEAQIAMLVVDLASRVLRDSDEVRNQQLKKAVLQELFAAWVVFTELYEREIRDTPAIDEYLSALYGAPEDGPEGDERESIQSFLYRLIPSMLVDSGITTCLASPSMTTLLSNADLSELSHVHHAEALRVVALLSSGGVQWVEALESLKDEALGNFFAAWWLEARVRYEYISNENLSEDDRNRVRRFLRRIVEVRYAFRSTNQRVDTVNKFENHLRHQRLLHRARNKTELGGTKAAPQVQK